MNLAILSDNSQVVTAHFNFEGFAVRTVQLDGEPWFIASDVCGVLDLDNVTMALKRLDGDEQALISIEGISRGNDQINIINESGLYSLILGSRKPNAKQFKRWVTGEVLPTIRKTGNYSAQPAPAFTLPDFTNPAAAARAWADAIEASQALAIERDHAIKTKAQISDKKTATAMATASKHSRENTKLKALMGEATENASIIAVQNKTGIKTYKWRDLKNYCAAAGMGMGKSFNPGLQMNVNTYPAGAWFEVYGVDLVDLFGEVAA